MDEERQEEGSQASPLLAATDQQHDVQEESSIPLVRVTSSSERSLEKASSQLGVQRDETRNNNTPAVNGDTEESREISPKKDELHPVAGSLSATALTKRNVNLGNGEVGNKLSDESVSSAPCCVSKVSHQDKISSSTHRVCLEEYAPSASSVCVKTGDWRMSLAPFSSKKWNKKEKNNLPRQVKRYYKTQNELITAFEELQLEVDDVMETADLQVKLAKKASILAKVSFFCNLVLLVAKSVAAAMTGSLSVISSVVDSAVDLVSGALMWWSGRAMKRRNIYQYPQGRTKLEPISIIILSVVMALASIQIIRESIEIIISYATNHRHGPTFDVTSIVICCTTIVVKLILFLVCRRIRTPSADALSQDHRNDVLSNTMAVTCGILGDRVLSYIDPGGAILISLYILVTWYQTGAEQIKMLTGHTARPDFMKKITWLALNHHPSIHFIDTVRAFHFGNNFLVECDIVLPEDMDLKTSHDIGESLQIKIERLPEVERAFVHMDYETDHSPYSEHKQV